MDDHGARRSAGDGTPEIDAGAPAHADALVGCFPDLVVQVDRARRYRWSSRASVAVVDTLARSLDDDVPAGARERVIATIERVFETGVADEFEIERTADDGAPLCYRTRALPSIGEHGEPRLLLHTCDVTEQRRSERVLRENEARVRTLLDHLPDHVIELDGERRIRFVNRSRSGRSEQSVLGHRIDDLAPPSMRGEVARKLDQLFSTGAPVEWTTARAEDGRAYAARAVLLPGSEPRALVIEREVSAEQEAIARLRTSEERLARAVEAGNIGVWELDLETGIVTGFGWMLRRLGVCSPTLARAAWVAAMHPEDRARAVQALADHVEGRAESYEAEYRVLHPRTKQWVHLLDRARVTNRDGAAKVVIGTTIDVTASRAADEERRELERRVEHMQRFESIGLLAGGIAHDFNNLLTVVTSSAQLARFRLAMNASADEELAHIIEAAERGAALTQQLLAFGRRSSLQMERVEAGRLVSAVVAMAARVFPRSIEIVSSAPRGDVVVRVDRHRLEQVLLNLCVNARDAMTDGGRLSISTEEIGDDVVIAVADTGTGISQSDLARIFDPFFTTKPVGGGTGLGLAVAMGIVQQHGGTIEAESEVGRGTVMRVRLPRDRGAVAGDDRAIQPSARGTETILLADDEPLVLASSRQILESAGYRVIAARDGREAVDLFSESSDGIDLVLLDVVMPRLDGWKAHLEIRAIAPHARVLLTSGYASVTIPPSEAAKGPRLLDKPYRPDALLRAVREVLDAPRAR